MKINTVLSSVLVSLVSGTAFAQSGLDAQDFMVNCISDMDGSDVTLVRSGGSDKGYIMTKSLQGEASIYPGLDSMTFLLMQDQEVVTFVVKYQDMKYDMMVKGGDQSFDHGTCALS